jgi:hypothetical protein
VRHADVPHSDYIDRGSRGLGQPPAITARWAA